MSGARSMGATGTLPIMQAKLRVYTHLPVEVLHVSTVRTGCRRRSRSWCGGLSGTHSRHAHTHTHTHAISAGATRCNLTCPHSWQQSRVTRSRLRAFCHPPTHR